MPANVVTSAVYLIPRGSNLRIDNHTMTRPPYNISEERPARVAILRALKLGDLLCFIPAVRALKAASPDSSVTLIGLPWARPFARRFSMYFDDFIEFPGWPGVPERPIDYPRIPQFLASAQRAPFDLALQCHGSGSHVNDIVTLLHAKHSAGFHQPSDGITNLDSWIPYPAYQPEIWRWLDLVCHLGGSFAGDHLEFPLSEEDFDDLAPILPRGILDRPYIIAHIGATTRRDQLWGVHNFAKVARHLYHKGYEIILTGTQEEQDLVRTLKEMCEIPAISVCGQTSLGSLGALTRNASLLISHDTGVAHLAVAVDTPSVIIHNRSQTLGWPPLNRIRHRFLSSFEPLRPAIVIEEIEELLSWRYSRPKPPVSSSATIDSFPNSQEML